jgi:hypothetical protein
MRHWWNNNDSEDGSYRRKTSLRATLYTHRQSLDWFSSHRVIVVVVIIIIIIMDVSVTGISFWYFS